MAFSIPLRMINESQESVTYEYEQPAYDIDPDNPKRHMVIGRHLGVVRLNKNSGEVTQISGADWDPENIIYFRAASVVIKCWRSGEFPQNTGYYA